MDRLFPEKYMVLGGDIETGTEARASDRLQGANWRWRRAD